MELALNEERCIEGFLERVSRCFETTLLAARLAGRHWG